MGNISGLWNRREADDEMVRAKKRPLDMGRVDQFAQKLKRAVKDEKEFNSLYTSIQQDASLSAAEVVEIAHMFVGGPKLKSKAAALRAIGQERHRLCHAKAKGESAAKTKVW